MFDDELDIKKKKFLNMGLLNMGTAVAYFVEVFVNNNFLSQIV